MPTRSGARASSLQSNGAFTLPDWLAADGQVPKLLLYWVVGLLLVDPGFAEAASEPAERIAWRKVPISLELRVGTERLVHFPSAVMVGLPAPLQGVVRIQSIAGTVYLLAHQAFGNARVVVRGLDDGRIYLLDLSAKDDSGDSGPVEIFNPDTAETKQETGAAKNSVARARGYVTLTRFAAQQLYAPARLLQDLPGVVRVPVKRASVPLLRGGSVEAMPLVAWRAGDLFLTAVKLTNKTSRPQILDPRTLRGSWLAATFQHNRLHRAGEEADRTVVYLISDRPFASSL